jgi:glycolate oxidase FAD binding subunit
VLARFAGGQSGVQAAEALAALEAAGLVAEIIEDDAELWDAQRRAQRSADGLLVRVSGVQTQLETQMRAADRAGGSLVGRAAGGLSWMALPLSSATDAAATLEDLRRELSPSPCVLLDAPPDVRERVEVWGVGDGSAVELMRRVKQRFDPAGACSPGAFVGGI